MLLRDLQPILAFTCDEVMAYAPAGARDGQDYAALLDWYQAPIALDEANRYGEVLDAAMELRSVVTKAIEDARGAGTFTKSQEVRVQATAPAEAYALLTGDLACDLAEFFIVSEVELAQGEEFTATVEAAHGERCDRCWNYRVDTGVHGEHEHICSRCAAALN